MKSEERPGAGVCNDQAENWYLAGCDALPDRLVSTFALFCAAMNQATPKTIETNVRNKIAAMPIENRIATAKEKLPRVVDHFLYLLELHENNATLAHVPQIPQSPAANAFSVFQRGLHQFEIVRLCALWDGVDLTKDNIPTVIELIDHPEIMEALAHGTEKGRKACHALHKAIRGSRLIVGSRKHTSMMNCHDRHLAHSLSETRHARNSPPAPAMKHGAEGVLLEKSLAILETLYCWVCGTSINFTESREIGRRNANSLWGACTFHGK